MDMKRIGLFVDINNLYYTIRGRFEGRCLDYNQYFDFVKDLGHIETAIAYGSEQNDEAKNFKEALKKIGFEVKYREIEIREGHRVYYDWVIGIVIDVVDMFDDFDMIVLGSANGRLSSLIEWCVDNGKEVVVLGSGIDKKLKETATTSIEIPHSLVEKFWRKNRKK